MTSSTQKYQYLIICFLFLSFVSCSDNSTNPKAKPIISAIEPAKTSPGDIITIFGSNLGYYQTQAKVILGNIEVPVSGTIKWNNSFIRLSLPLNFKSGDIFVILNSDTSNKYYYSVSDKPSIEMIEVSAGEFIMGSENGFGYERPAHKVKLTKGFSISKFEITQKIWQIVAGYNNSPVKAENLPVMNITWEEAVEFCNKLSNVFGLDTAYLKVGNNFTYNQNAKGYRLPTEAEWEYACRAGSAGDYPGSGNMDDIGWYDGNSAYNPHTVGTKLANAWGLYDMNGNVWEWCWDWYYSSYYAASTDINPTGPANGTIHVLRGGSCVDGATFARSANRTYLSKEYIYCGIRIVRTK